MPSACPSASLTEGASLGFEQHGIRLFVVRRAGQVYAYKNRCPHRGVPLEWQPNQFLDTSASLMHESIRVMPRVKRLTCKCKQLSNGRLLCSVLF